MDPAAVVYCRYDRIIGDIRRIGNSVILDPGPSDEARAEEAEMAIRVFPLGGIIDTAETATLQWAATTFS